jgi:hypothetical protein
LSMVADIRGPTHRIICQVLSGTYAAVGRMRPRSLYIMSTRTASRTQTQLSPGVVVPSARLSGSNAPVKMRRAQDILFRRVASPCSRLTRLNITSNERSYSPLVGKDYGPSGDKISVVLVVFIKKMRSSWRVGQ